MALFKWGCKRGRGFQDFLTGLWSVLPFLEICDLKCIWKSEMLHKELLKDCVTHTHGSFITQSLLQTHTHTPSLINPTSGKANGSAALLKLTELWESPDGTGCWWQKKKEKKEEIYSRWVRLILELLNVAALISFYGCKLGPRRLQSWAQACDKCRSW